MNLLRLPSLLLSVLLTTAVSAPVINLPGQTSAPVNKDSLLRAQSSADSLQKKHRYDSLQAIQTAFLNQYRQFPSSADSLYQPDNIGFGQIFGADGSGITDAIAFSPRLFRIPVALSSQLNRLGYNGFLLPPGGLTLSTSSAGFGNDMLTTPSLIQVKSDLAQGIVPDQTLLGLVAPHTSIYWENGLFNSNILGVRFARPLTRNLTIGILSSYRNMPLANYSHDNGNIYLFYADLTADTSLLAHRGRHGLIDEQLSGIRLAWRDTTNRSASLLWNYFDMKNDRAREISSTTGPTLVWERLYQFGNQATVQVGGPISKTAALQGGAAITKYGSAIYATPDFNKSGVSVQGRVFNYSFWLRPTVTIKNDTLLFSYRYAGTDVEQYTVETARTWQTHTADLGYNKYLSLANVNLMAAARAGGIYAVTPDSVAPYIHASLSLQAALPYCALNIYALHNALEKQPSLDTADNAFNSILPAAYDAAGLEATLRMHFGGVLLGYHYKSTVTKQISASYWPYAIMPFAEPNQVMVVAPFLGRQYGFAASSRWYVADRRPYLKSYSEISYEASVMQGREHLRADLGLDYWGARDTISFGGITTWNREIVNLSLKLSVQIESFRLFYKIDNLLNRSIAYVPGYTLPGLTFRWGFSWIIPG